MATSMRETSVASSLTLRQTPAIELPFAQDYSSRATTDYEDVPMEDANVSSEDNSAMKRFVIAIDYGTTFSSVSLATLNGNERVGLDQIQSINNYPNDPRTSGQTWKEVPTESWYPDRKNSQYSAFEEPGMPADDSVGDPEHLQISWQEAHEAFRMAEETPENEVRDGVLWGFMVQEALRLPFAEAHQNKKNRRVSRAKLLLDKSHHTEQLRRELKETLQELKRRKLIKRDGDVHTDYLTCLFRHAKQELEARYSFSTAYPTEFVLCVPAIWTPEASRTMQAAMATAMRRTGLAALNTSSVDNLFIVSEPEAAAAFVLAGTDQIRRNDIFVLLDAGGGTVDAITYTVDKAEPLRLKRETIEPGGGLHGSSFINEAFREFIYDKLKDEKYLEETEENLTIDGIIDSLVMIEFENRIKRQMDFSNAALCDHIFYIPGLRPNEKKRFRRGQLCVRIDDFWKVFEPTLIGVASLMLEQIQGVKQKGMDVDKVILIGGFADSPALVQYLKREIRRLSERFGTEIRLITPSNTHERLSLNQSCGTAVASGAVLRALNKDAGPDRILRSSYGVLRNLPFEPDQIPQLKEGKRTYDHLDGDWYVKDVIDWVIKKGDTIPPRETYVIPAAHTFDTRHFTKFLCEEKLYVSDTSTESYYQIKSPKNDGCTHIGTIIVDMTFLKTEKRIKPVVPAKDEKGRKHYKVEFDILIEVDGRNLKYSARWPRGNDGVVLTGAQAEDRVSIAAAFDPGTK